MALPDQAIEGLLINASKKTPGRIHSEQTKTHQRGHYLRRLQRQNFSPYAFITLAKVK